VADTLPAPTKKDLALMDLRLKPDMNHVHRPTPPEWQKDEWMPRGLGLTAGACWACP